MICDGNNPMCIAGVYGGKNHSVSENTTTIFLFCIRLFCLKKINNINYRRNKKHY